MNPGVLEIRWAYAGLGLLAVIELLVALYVKGAAGLTLLALLLLLQSLALWLFQRLSGSFALYRRQKELLKQQNAFLLQAVTDARVGLIFVDMEGGISYVNDTLAEWLGRAPQELMAHDPTTFMVFQPQGNDAELFQRWAAENHTYQVEAVHSAGHTLRLQITSTPRWFEGRIVGNLATVKRLPDQAK